MADTTKIFEGVDYRAVGAKRGEFGRTYFHEHAGTSPRAIRFGKMQLRVLKGHVSFADPLQAVAASLLLFDGIATRRSIVPALIAAPDAYEWRNRIYLEWPGIGGRTDRRLLSNFTLEQMKHLPTQVSHSEAIESLKSAAYILYPGAGDPIGTMIGDAQAWLLDVMPGVLLGHVLETNPQAALPRGALAREETKMALVVQAGPAEGESDTALGVALDAYFATTVSAGSSWLVDELLEICKRNRKLKEREDKRRMLIGLLDLAYRAQQADAESAIVLAWTIDLVESGTRLTPDIHTGTVADYVRLIAQALRIHFQGIRLTDIKADEFQKIYEKIIAGISDGQKRNARSALSSWHVFIMHWLGVVPLKQSLYDPADDATPKANVIWPHEMDLVEEWLDHAVLDERLRGQLVVAFAIAKAVRIRAGELLYLRLLNVQAVDRTLTIEICPLLRDGRLKTASARRTMVVEDHMAAQIILDWKECRRKEDALGEDLLFGDPHQADRIYQFGKFYVIINQILKAVTGDREASLHTLSHTWISDAIDAALMAADGSIDINRLDEIAVSAGHKTVQTSLDHYFHRFEEPIRRYLDIALAKIKLTSDDAARLSGVTATALRARASARKVGSHVVYWEAIRARAVDIRRPNVADGIATASAIRLPALSVRRTPRFSDVLHALEDIAAGRPLDVVASRGGRCVEWAGRVALAAIEVLRDLPAVARGQIDIRRGLSPAQAALALRAVGNEQKPGIDFSRARQPKYLDLIAHLEQVPFDEFTGVMLDAWQRCYAGRYLALADAVAAGHVFSLLAKAKVAPVQLAISISTANPDHPDEEKLTHEAELSMHFGRCFGLPAIFDWKAKRGGKPAAFLIWSSVSLTVGCNPVGAATSITGFNAIMLAASVHAALVAEDGSRARRGHQSSRGSGHA